MVRMVRSKKEYVCSACGFKAIKWGGICSNCKKGGTLVEKQLLPEKVKPKATKSQKSLMRRSKTSERNIAKGMVAVDGPDPAYAKIATSTGRIGHITNIRADAISRTYLTENKNRVLPKWVIDAWILILQRSEDFDKHALLHLEPPNLPKEYPINGVKRKTGTMAVITQAHHEQLIIESRQNEEIREVMASALSNVEKVKKIRDILGLNG